MHVFHKWSKWKQYIKETRFIPFKYPECEGVKTILRESRKCFVCGTVQDREIEEFAELFQEEEYQEQPNY